MARNDDNFRRVLLGRTLLGEAFDRGNYNHHMLARLVGAGRAFPTGPRGNATCFRPARRTGDPPSRANTGGATAATAAEEASVLPSVAIEAGRCRFRRTFGYG